MHENMIYLTNQILAETIHEKACIVLAFLMRLVRNNKQYSYQKLHSIFYQIYASRPLFLPCINSHMENVMIYLMYWFVDFLV
jgi:hypothetical protein